jgi:hypothetical protein
MIKFNRVIVGFSACLLVAGLSGCSREPSSGDITQIIKSVIDTSNQSAGNDSAYFITIESIKKLGCTKDSAEYVCDVDEVVSSKALGRKEGVFKMRLVKGTSGWVLLSASL